VAWVWTRQLLVWGAAGLTIAVAYRLYNRFRRRYLRDWFLFVVVFNLGLYVVDLLKTVFPGVLPLGGESLQQVETAFFALLVRPLVFVGLLLFLRFVSGMIEVRVSRGWRLAATIYLTLYVGCLVFLAIRFFGGGSWKPDPTMVVVSDWLAIGGIYGAVAYMMSRLQGEEAEPKRQLLRNLGILFFVCQTVLVFFPARQPQLLAGFFLILPPLLYLWRIHQVLFSGQRQIEAPGADLELFLSEARLTAREREIALLICRGRGNQEIADELHVSIHTVKHQVTSIFQKLAVENRIQLANLVSNQFGKKVP
jgi:DNA-binding CsgD family transcriptional regulator